MINFANSSGPHIALSPETVWHIGGVPITNSQLYAWLVGITILLLLNRAAHRMSVLPSGGYVRLVEMGVGFVMSILTSNLHSANKARQYAPFFATIFFFILLNNWMGLLPGVGPSIFITSQHGESPLLRPFTADLNGTLALAIVAIIMVQAIAIKEQGGLNHLKHYFGGNFKNPINLFVGVLEIFGEITRVVSLSLRLFFNVLIGEILISIFTYLGKYAAPLTTLPFLAMELFVGFVQAYIFTMLCATYLGIAISHGDDHEDDNGVNDHSTNSEASPSKLQGVRPMH